MRIVYCTINIILQSTIIYGVKCNIKDFTSWHGNQIGFCTLGVRYFHRPRSNKKKTHLHEYTLSRDLDSWSKADFTLSQSRHTADVLRSSLCQSRQGGIQKVKAKENYACMHCTAPKKALTKWRRANCSRRCRYPPPGASQCEGEPAPRGRVCLSHSSTSI